MSTCSHSSDEEHQALSSQPTRLSSAAWKPSQLESVARLCAQLVDERDPQIVYRRIVDGALDLLGGDRAAVFHAEGERVICVASSGLSARHIEATCDLGDQNPGVSTLSDHKVVCYGNVGNGASCGPIADFIQSEGIHAAIAAPMAGQGYLPGALVIYYDQPRVFTELEREIARFISTLAAAAVENAHVFQERDRHAERLEMLNEIGLAVSGTLDLNDLFRVIYEGVGKVLPCDAFYIAFYDPEMDEERLGFAADHGILHPREDRRPVGNGPCGWVIRHRKPFFLGQENATIQHGGMTFGTDRPSKSAIHVPMMQGHRVIGVMSVQSYTSGSYDQQDLSLMETLAAQTAVAVENARLFAITGANAEENHALLMESNKRADRLAALNEIGVAVSRVLNLDALYEVVYRQTIRVLKADAFYIALRSGEDHRILFPFLMDSGVRHPPAEIAFGEGHCSRVLRDGRPIVINRPDSTPTFGVPTFGEGMEGFSAVFVPMALGDRVMGVISAQSYEQNAYGDEDVRMLQTVAAQTAVAVENARLYQMVEEASLTDELTGLPNRRAITARLEEELSRSSRYGFHMCVLILDLDYFKDVNDTCGHSGGDQALRELSLLLRGSLRAHDGLGRWGGEEFLVVLVHTDLEGGRHVAEHLRQCVEQHVFLNGRLKHRLTLSVGGVALQASEEWDVAMVLDAADTCMYQAKAGGRNRVVLREG